MPLAAHVKPDVGYLVDIVLASGGTLQGYWDGLQWWCGVDVPTPARHGAG